MADALDPSTLVLRAVESLEGMRSELAQARLELSVLRQDLNQVRQDGQSRGAAQALTEAEHGHALSDIRDELQGVRKELQRREDREDAAASRSDEARRSFWGTIGNGVRAVWSDPTFRALIAAAAIGWLGIQADVIRFVPGLSGQ